MSDYSDGVLIDTPALYPRLDMVGPASNGDSIPDSSANGLDLNLTLIGSAPANPYGFASPIETDISSRSFFCQNNILTGQSIITLSSTSEIEPTGDVALEIWVRYPGLASQLVAKEKNFDGVCFSLTIDTNGRFTFNLRDTAGTLWTVTDPGDGGGQDERNQGDWWHVVGVRVVDTLAIYVSATLRATTNITSGLPTLSESGPFRIGTGTSAGGSFYIDEPALYTHSLTGTRIAAHFEAAINATLLSGYSNVIPSAILYSDFEPDPIHFPFRHNWTQNLVERIGFLSGLSTARSGAEEANGARIKPRREIEFTHVIRDNDERQQLRAQLKVNQNRKWFIPILEHREFLSAPLPSGATTIPANTLYKDYEVGGYCELRELNADQQVVNSEVLQIASFTTTEIVPTMPTANDYPALLSQVGPARRGLLSGSISPRGHTDSVEEVQLTARLLAEDEKTIPNRIIPWTPTITYKSHEVYDPQEWQSNDWSELREYAIDRASEEQGFDTGIFEVESDTTEASESFSWSVKLKGIEKIAAFLGWFYYHAGSLIYLWVPSMQRDLTIVSAVGSNLTVSKHTYTNNFAGSQTRRDLAFVYNDNSMILRRINSSTTSGANDVLTLNTSVPTQTNLRSVSYLKFCRIEADTLEKALAVDDVMLATWRFRELLHSPD